MKFEKILGRNEEQDKAIIRQTEEKLSSLFTELSLNYTTKAMGSGLGGDPFIFQLMYPYPHICDNNSVVYDDLEKQIKELVEKKKAGEDIDQAQLEKLIATQKSVGKLVLRTAATDGKRYYWNPQFVMKLSKIGLRIVMAHEAWHAIYMHPGRRAARIPSLWNIAVDYKVNFMVLEDLKTRQMNDPPKMFRDNLGEFITIEEYAQFLRDPFNPPERFAHWSPIHDIKGIADPNYKHPGDNSPPTYFADAALSDDMKRPENVYNYLLAQIPKCPKCGKMGNYKKSDEYKKIEKELKDKKKAEAQAKADKEKSDGQKSDASDPSKDQNGDKSDDHKHSDNGAECKDPNCKDGDHKSDKNGKPSKSDGNQPGDQPGDNSGNQPGDQPGDQPGNNPGTGQGGNCCDDENQGQGSSCGSGEEKGGDCCGDQCDTCGGDDYGQFDTLGRGDLMDKHFDTDVTEEELTKRMYDASLAASKMAGKVPLGLEIEIGKLMSPVVRWQDIIRSKITRIRQGGKKNDWTNFKSRPMFAGLMVPKKRDFNVNMLVAIDASGSMSADDKAYAISQLQVLDSRVNAHIVFFDTTAYFDKMIKLNKFDTNSLKSVKAYGGGGTDVRNVFEDYEKYCDDIDLIVVCTDSFLSDVELKGIKEKKGTDTCWIITANNPSFKPPFGRILHLRDQ